MNTKAIELLRDMLENGPTDSFFGICYNLHKTSSANRNTVDLDTERTGVDGYNIVTEHSPSWEHFSGDENYPVVYQELPYPESAPLWEGKQLVLRQSLIKHIISRLEA